MKILVRTFAALVAAVAMMAAVILTSCNQNPEPIPTITITTQPTAPANLVEGSISIDTHLTVAASATEDATLSYQWYTNWSSKL